MKIIEGLKEVQRLEEQAKDLTQKIGKYCADRDYETPTYKTPEEQRSKIKEWLQGVHDTLKVALELRIKIQRTNDQTIVPIELGGQKVEHSIAEWILRRRFYATMEGGSWGILTDRGLAEGTGKNSAGEMIVIKKRLYYDQTERDKNMEIFRSEPGIIDRCLEVANATTELIG